MQEEHLVVREALHGAVDQLDHAEDPMLRLEWDADDRARLPLRHFVDTLGKARIVVDVRNKERLAMLGNPAGDAFSDFQADALKCVSSVTDGDGKIEFVFLLVDHQ